MTQYQIFFSPKIYERIIYTVLNILLIYSLRVLNQICYIYLISICPYATVARHKGHWFSTKGIPRWGYDRKSKPSGGQRYTHLRLHSDSSIMKKRKIEKEFKEYRNDCTVCSEYTVTIFRINNYFNPEDYIAKSFEKTVLWILYKKVNFKKVSSAFCNFHYLLNHCKWKIKVSTQLL